MVSYAWMYRLGITPWERYRATAGDSVARLLDREQAERVPPLGRALDLGCGRGRYTPELARRGWEPVGIDAVPSAIEAAQRQGSDSVTYVGVSQAEVEETFPDWDLLSVDAAETAGLGWPMNRASPTWYRLRRRL